MHDKGSSCFTTLKNSVCFFSCSLPHAEHRYSSDSDSVQ